MSTGHSPPAPNPGGAGEDVSELVLPPQDWGRGGLLVACLLVRLAWLDADPPPWLSWSTGLCTDEGFYTLDARHLALFGTSAPGDFHDRLLSPLLSLLQQGVFSLFGPGLVQARLLSVLFGLLTVGVFWLGLRRVWGAQAADYGALFLGLAPPFALYNRLALQETPTVFWLALAFTLWAYGARRPALCALAGLSVGAAAVFKGLALLATPALLALPAPNAGGAGTGRGTGTGRGAGTKREAERGEGAINRAPTAVSGLAPPALGAGGAVLGLALYAALWYLPHHAELARMATFYRVHQMQPHSLHSLGLNVRRAFLGGERGVFPYLLALLPVPCALAGWGLWERKDGDAARRFFAPWLAGGLLFCLVSSYAPSRYYVLFLPALAGLAARGLMQTRRPIQALVVAAFVLTSAAWYGAAWAGRSYARRDAGRELARLLPPGSVVVGEFAPALCLDTPFAAAPVQPGLSNDDRPVERLKATHVAVTRAAIWQDWWRTRYPNIVQPSHRVATFDLGGARHYRVDVYAVKEGR